MKKKGFTLAEILIVVAIIAVLVAISIPIFRTQLHKAEVAADYENVRSYFSQLQYYYLETGNINDTFLNDDYFHPITTFELSGQTIKLKAGFILVREDGTKGYNILYMCNQGHPDCQLVLPVS